MKITHEQWASKIGFVLAAAGSAIGLGAIWKFPYVAGTSGGGAFLLLFLLFMVLLGYPLLLAEFSIGRFAGSDAVSAYKKISPSSNSHIIGLIGLVTCFIILSFYSVIGGWIIIYIFHAISGSLSRLTVEQYNVFFQELISNPFATILAQLIFMIITIFVIARGIQDGIEKVSRFMMPALLILFILIVVRSLTLENAWEGVRFIFYPDFSKLTTDAILFALGQAFFSLSVGMSIMVTYSSYVPKSQSLPKSAFSVVLMNVFIAILAGLAIFPGVFTYGLEPSAGPTLIFSVLPTVFEQMFAGTLFMILFFLLFLFAALTSAFSLLEMIVAVIIKGDSSKRNKTAWIVGLSVFALGVPSCLSFGVLSNVLIWDKTIFDIADYVTSNILIPLGGLFIALFVAYRFPKQQLLEEIQLGSGVTETFMNIWFILIKYFTPIAIIIVFLDAIGMLSFLK
ncbi:sodium-dependent transporter [Aeribacillus alveayuensis]|uniref:Transporter n=1 Tax=Aeribacillus alveayuensis TaxID=279215 RepID=A0ABT9VSY2_9BACI|nr:NSS family neurotransmitter:Na+ symporter [Bacillus alveayuensis]